MKRYISFLLSLIIIFSSMVVPAEEYHVHSSILIDGVRQNVNNGIEPWASAYEKLKNTLPSTVLTGVPTVFEIPRFDSTIANAHRNIITNHAHNAYWHALIYAIEGNTSSGDLVVSILKQWSENNKQMRWSHASDPTKKYDTQLVASTTGVGLVYAAGLIEGYSGWTDPAKEKFKTWVRNVLLPCINGARNRTNNWSSWSVYASAVSNDYLADEAGFNENTNYLKRNIDLQIDSLGRMPEELKRDLDQNGKEFSNDELNGIKGLWYTYYSLAPMTVHAQLVLNKTGEDLFQYESSDDRGSIKKALDCFLEYVKDYASYNPNLADPNYPYKDNNLIPYPHSIWPSNLYEAMAAVYGDMDYYDYIGGDSNRPIEYNKTRLGFSWIFPTLLKEPGISNPYTAKVEYIYDDGINYAEAQIVNNSTEIGRKVLFATASYDGLKMEWIQCKVITLNDGLKHVIRQELEEGRGKTIKSFLIDLQDMSPVLNKPAIYIRN